MTWVRLALWVPFAAVLFSLACPSESLALSATEITGTWTGTWTSRVYTNTSGTVTLILSGTESFGLGNLTGTITMTGPGKSTIAQLPIRQGFVTEDNTGFSVEAIPPGEVYPCFVSLIAFSPDVAPTRIAGRYTITTYCLPSIVDGGVFEIAKTGRVSLDQQAQLDMISRAARDPRFGAADIGTFGSNPNWDPNWELRWMDFAFSAGRVVTIYHTTSHVDWAYRYTTFLDPDTGQWANWEPAD